MTKSEQGTSFLHILQFLCQNGRAVLLSTSYRPLLLREFLISCILDYTLNFAAVSQSTEGQSRPALVMACYGAIEKREAACEG